MRALNSTCILLPPLLLLMKCYVFFFFISFHLVEKSIQKTYLNWAYTLSALHIVTLFLMLLLLFCFSFTECIVHSVHNNMQWQHKQQQWQCQQRRQQAIATTFHCKTYFISLFLSFATISYSCINVQFQLRHTNTYKWKFHSLPSKKKRNGNKNKMKFSCIFAYKYMNTCMYIEYKMY